MTSFVEIRPILFVMNCEAVVRIVSAGELQRTLTAMELTLDVASAICPHCGAMNLFPGFSCTLAFTCQQR